MRHLFFSVIVMLGMAIPSTQAKDLVAYFSAQGNTKAVAERIAELMGAGHIPYRSGRTIRGESLR